MLHQILVCSVKSLHFRIFLVYGCKYSYTKSICKVNLAFFLAFSEKKFFILFAKCR